MVKYPSTTLIYSIIRIFAAITCALCWYYIFLHLYMYEKYGGHAISGEFIYFHEKSIKVICSALFMVTLLLLRIAGSAYVPFHKYELRAYFGIILLQLVHLPENIRKIMEGWPIEMLFFDHVADIPMCVAIFSYLVFGYLQRKSLEGK